MSQSPHLWLGTHPSFLVTLPAPFCDPDQHWSHGVASHWKPAGQRALPLTGLTTRFSSKIQDFKRASGCLCVDSPTRSYDREF